MVLLRSHGSNLDRSKEMKDRRHISASERVCGRSF